MSDLRGRTRKLAAKWIMLSLSLMFLRVILSGVWVFKDLPPNATSILVVAIPSLIAGLLGFFTEQAFSNHSQRKNGTDQ